MKIYTKTGDDGSTGLFGGGRVSKASLRVEAYGCVDELNSTLGLARASMQGAVGENAALKALDALLLRLQGELFVLGADLATPRTTKSKALIDRLDAQAVSALEAEIDTHEASLEPLRNFILPGGTLPGSWLHLARTVCRRAERRCVVAAVSEDLGEVVVHYLNRLSDLLFVLGRYANHCEGVVETPWIPR